LIYTVSKERPVPFYILNNLVKNELISLEAIEICWLNSFSFGLFDHSAGVNCVYLHCLTTLLLTYFFNCWLLCVFVSMQYASGYQC